MKAWQCELLLRYQEPMDLFYKRLHRLRSIYGFLGLASVMGVNPSSITNWFNLKRHPSRQTQEHVALLLLREPREVRASLRARLAEACKAKTTTCSGSIVDQTVKKRK